MRKRPTLYLTYTIIMKSQEKKWIKKWKTITIYVMSITLESYLSGRFTEYDDYLHFGFWFYFRFWFYIVFKWMDTLQSVRAYEQKIRRNSLIDLVLVSVLKCVLFSIYGWTFPLACKMLLRGDRSMHGNRCVRSWGISHSKLHACIKLSKLYSASCEELQRGGKFELFH